MIRLPRQKLRIASVGLGNWAGRTADLLLQQHQLSSSGIELVYVVEPNEELRARKIHTFKQHAVRVVAELDAALNDDSIEAVILPVPIHLHRSFTERALHAGKAVMVEKPVAACVQDVDAMIAARDRARRPVLVAYQDIYDPSWLRLKRKILAGDIGDINSASLLGCWPRDEAYYSRTEWAGKLKYAGQWVLDSPLTNACAHYLNLILFLLGRQETEWGQPTSVEAELYRAYDIENYDTTSQRLTVSGVPVLIHLTHACEKTIGPVIHLQGSQGQVRVDLDTRIARVETRHQTHSFRLCPDARLRAIDAFAAHVQNRHTDSVLATLEAARPHVLAANGASQTALVQSVSPKWVQPRIDECENRSFQIKGIEKAMQLCTERKHMLHESGLVDWSVPPGQLSLVGYNDFEGCPSQATFVSRLATGKHCHQGRTGITS